MAPTQARDYDIDAAIVKWVSDPHIQSRLRNGCTTAGDWTVWTQLELEMFFIDEFGFISQGSIREPFPNINVSNDSSSSSNANEEKEEEEEEYFLFLQRKQGCRGMIVVLECENKGLLQGKAVGEKVRNDVQRINAIKSGYEGHVFVVFAFVHSEEGRCSVVDAGMEMVHGIELAVGDGVRTLSMFKTSIEASEEKDVMAERSNG